MCELCKRRICPPGCPNGGAVGDVRAVRCAGCGEKLRAGERYFRIHGFPYCEDCLREADAETLVRICEIPMPVLLERLGFLRCLLGEEDV